jgi:alcohol dehydrogenase (cytochrome c)
MCPSPSGGNNFWPSAYSPKTKLLYVPALTNCAMVTQDPKLSVRTAEDMRGGPRANTNERYETDVSAIDPFTGEVKIKAHIPFPNYSGAVATAGGLVFTGFTDGTMMALDDTTMQPLWKINVGVGFDAPPMTFEVDGKQYVAILSGLSRIAIGKHVNTPELKEQRNQTMLFVFGL